MSSMTLFLEFVGKSVVFLMGLPLYVTCLFSFAAFYILSLFCVLSVLIMMCLCLVLIILCSVIFLYVGDFLFIKVREVFRYYFIK
jgi:hypothetical protein